MANLMFESGEGVTLAELQRMPDPQKDGKYHLPVRHDRFIGVTKEAAEQVGLLLVNIVMALSCKGASLFWAADVEVASTSPLYGLLKDKGNYTLVGRKDDLHRRAVEVWGGERAWICSNLQIQGDNLICKKKQTLGLSLMDELISGFAQFENQALETRRLNDVAHTALITDDQAKGIIHDAVVDGVVNLNATREVGANYFQPESSWEDCHPRSKGGLLAAFTRHFRPLAPEKKITSTTEMCRRLLRETPELVTVNV